MRKLLLWTVLLAVGEAATPIPAQTTVHAANSATGEKPQSVAISEFPSVSVSKDWADWGYWGFGGLLVVVGFLQVGLIKRQAVLMKAQTEESKESSRKMLEVIVRQTELIAEQARNTKEANASTLEQLTRQVDLMEKQTDAAAKSATAFINKERSRVFIRAEITDDFCATFYAHNKGNSPARITYGFVGCEIFSANQKFHDTPDYTGGDPAWVFRQNEWILPHKESIIGDYSADYISATDNPELHASVMSGESTVWFYGVVRYTDSVSEEEHEVRFCYETNIRSDTTPFVFEGGPEPYRRET